MNLATDMAEGQGLNKDIWYAATVVHNNDPDKYGRIQARVKEIFDGIPDEDLPWAISAGWNHPDGAFGSSGILLVPKVGTKVQVRFQKGSPMYPEYRGYNVDKGTALQEAEMNYPNRAVLRFQNNSMMIVDTQANIIYMRSPGDCRICVVGDLQLEVLGNVAELVHGNVTRHIQGNLDETIDGSHSVTVKGDFKEHISGKSHTQSADHLISAQGQLTHSASAAATVKAGGVLSLEGSPLQENGGTGAGDPGSPGDAAAVQLKDWPGIRGAAPGDGFSSSATKEDVAVTNFEGATPSKEALTAAGMSTAPNNPTETEKSEVAPPAKTAAPKDCSAFEAMTDFPPTTQLSTSFNLGMLSTNAALQRNAVAAQQGLTAAQIVCNLSQHAKNMLEPITAKYGKPVVTSGFRLVANASAPNSWHTKGSATDLQWPGISDKEYYDRAVWIKDNLPFSEVILEYGANRPWIHVAYNSTALSTTNFKTRVSVNNGYKQGIILLKNQPGVGGVTYTG
jgi:uncharacterized protein YcbK (DUF882 family)